MSSRDFSPLFYLGRVLSPLYSIIMGLRAFFYKKGLLRSRRLSVPVISIGNLTLGGTGKTPLVMYVSRYLLGMGRKPAIVSRGYGGRSTEAVNIVSDGRKVILGPGVAGDEPALLAESLAGVPVLTGLRKARVGQYATEHFPIDTVILDDGFQHLALARDLDLVLFSARTFLGSGWVFPGGELREPFSALKRAHAFVVTGVDHSLIKKAEDFKRFLGEFLPHVPVFMGEYLPVCLLHSQRTKTFSIDRARRQLLYGFAGIANPDSFRRSLEKENFKLVGFQAFRDHHRYSARQVEALVAEAKARRAQALITTEKDFVKLKPFFGDFPILALKVELFMEEEFDFFLYERLRSLR